MRRNLQARWVPVAVVLAVVVSGCRGGADRRAPAAAGRWQSQGSTLGSDLLRAPRGISIPATSMGVDLVRYPGDAARGSGTVERAALPAQP